MGAVGYTVAMATTRSLDYPTLTKRGFLLGLGLFVVGGLGEIVLHAAGITVPAWESTLLFDMEVLGVIIGLFAPLVFGIILPLTE